MSCSNVPFVNKTPKYLNSLAWCSSFQRVLKVIDQRGEQNHIICRKQKCKPKAPEQDSLLALAAPQDPVHENEILDRIERVALVEPNIQGENA